MLRFPGRIELFKILLFPLLLLIPACAGEESSREDTPINAALAPQMGTEAGMALAAALTEANRTDRLVFVHTGADW